MAVPDEDTKDSLLVLVILRSWAKKAAERAILFEHSCAITSTDGMRRICTRQS